MSISVDATVVRWTASATNTTTYPSASFTPTNGSLLVVCVNLDEPTANLAVDVTGGSLTWTERIRRGDTEATSGIASIWTAPVVTGSSMQVSIARTSSGVSRISAKVYIVTGQHASPIGNTNSASWTTNPQTLAITASGDGRLFGCGTDFNQTGLPQSTDTADAADYSGEISVMSAYKAADYAAGSGSQTIQFDPVGTPAGNVVVLEILAAASGAATLSGATPSGVIGQTTTVTVGATTNQVSGTFYAVVDSAANLSGVTASQIKAGQKAAGTAALSSQNSSVSSTTPTAICTGLSPATLYSYAAVQNTTGGDSNVVTGTFTTATASTLQSTRDYGPRGFIQTLVGM